MLTILTTYASLKMDRRGVTALEYAIIAGVMGLVLVTAFTALGTEIKNLFTKVGGEL